MSGPRIVAGTDRDGFMDTEVLIQRLTRRLVDDQERLSLLRECG